MGDAPLTRAERLALADKATFDPQYGTPLKRSIIAPSDEEAIKACWADIISTLADAHKEITTKGPSIIPEVDFADLYKLTDAQKDEIRQVGSVVVHNVVDDEKALEWKAMLREYVKANPQVEGFPEGNMQFFQMYWAKSQVQARADPNVIGVQKALNALWTTPRDPNLLISFSTPVAYADRFRIRTDPVWKAHPPHIDGAKIERWADDSLRSCFASVLKGQWKEHDPFVVDGRIPAETNIHKKPGQASIFRSWQGWLAMSNTGPGEGTLKVFPNVQLSNAYVVLRPFFRLRSPDLDPMQVENWEYDPDTAHYPGLQPQKSMRLNEDTHPHLRLTDTMTCMPRVLPGDMVFWHCDVIHSVEEEHNGPSDSSVMYIPACPMTLRNASYLARQRETFKTGATPPDYGMNIKPETGFALIATEEDIVSVEGKRAMGFAAFPIDESAPKGEKDLLREANRLLGFA
ncbi:DUF1479-domain-containing protein [Calocera viscosa TUFC12733]|uniref:DUF1479-domain-containing protein n=1 Tax=Calocera viscosa (strain TUFC12733) TaxID=1330018 RepID=A0A167N989_CALVF|nr:DUF1479-domain-containing protein [Calocera viscosa TUFC12733]